jgi:transposase
MARDDFLAVVEALGGWEGFTIGSWRTENSLEPDAFGLPAKRLIIELQPAPDAVRRCGRCGAPVEAVHDVTERRVRDVPLMGFDLWLVFPHARVQCPRCGPTSQQLSWVDRYQRMTTRLAETIARLAQVFGIKSVATLFHLGWDAVKQMHARALTARLGPMAAADFSRVRRIAIDEFAIHKGQTYATLVVDVETKRVLWVARGRDTAALDGFFAALGPAGCARIQAVVTDLARPFVRAVRTHCPRAAMVFDLFHALQRYTAQVLDPVRYAEANRIAQPNRHVGRQRIEGLRRHLTGKGVRWLLLRARANLRSRTERVRLKTLLAANHALFIVYVLKEDLRALWHYRSPTAARRAWRHWYARACESGIPLVVRFAHRLALVAEYIINHARHPLHTSLIEGINNKIKVMKRMAYGYRDDAYFFLKIRAAFPGIP